MAAVTRQHVRGPVALLPAHIHDDIGVGYWVLLIKQRISARPIEFYKRTCVVEPQCDVGALQWLPRCSCLGRYKASWQTSHAHSVEEATLGTVTDLNIGQ